MKEDIQKIKERIFSVSLSQYFQSDYYLQIAPLVKGKNILDVGCVDHDIYTANVYRLWNHYFLYKISRKVVGIDITKKSLALMTALGFHVRHMNAETISYTHIFDVVFAGELIEHLTNPGLFIQSATQSLKKDGRIVLSTPNTYAISKIIRVIQNYINEPPQNPDHTMYFTPKTISKLAEKCGLTVESIHYAHFPFMRNTLSIILNKLICLVLGERFKEIMIVVLKK